MCGAVGYAVEQNMNTGTSCTSLLIRVPETPAVCSIGLFGWLRFEPDLFTSI